MGGPVGHSRRQGAGVSGTPAFLINEILLPGALPLDQLQMIIEQALAGAGDQGG